MLALALWTLPFLWIGVSMSLRRAVDSGHSAWLAVCFFVPYLKYLLMLWLCLLPTTPASYWSEREPEAVAADRRRSALLGLGAALAVTIPTILLGVYFKRNYSFGLFLGTPFTAGWVSAQVFNTHHPRTTKQSIALALLAVLVAGIVLIAFAAEGAFCLFLAFPLAALVAIPGALLGRAVALRGRDTVGMAALLAPLLVLTEPKLPPPSYEVVSTVEIAAPPDRVWQRVVSFPEIPPPTEWLFRIGVAAPQRARIVGTGVGATRYCDFTTGSFVEPITVWDPGHRLAFDIVRQAPPMHEWSPYRDVNPPHLDGYFRATHGEFELTALPGGRTRLVGRTRYEVDMAPQGYWAVAAGQIVSAIHLRVLRHIQRIVETGSSAR